MRPDLPLRFSRRNTTIDPQKFLSRLREYPRDPLLRGIAEVTARFHLLEEVQKRTPEERQITEIQEGYLSQVASLCIRSCSIHRSRSVDHSNVLSLMNDLYNTHEPRLFHDADVDDWQQYLSNTAYTQLPNQQTLIEPMMRSLCLFGDDPRFGPPMSDEIDWLNALGVSLQDWLRIGFILFTTAANNRGIAHRSLLSDRKRFRLVYGPLQPETVMNVIDQWFARPISRMVQMARHANNWKTDLWGANVLFEFPLVRMDDDCYLIPSPRAVLNRIGPQGLYFIGRDQLDPGVNKSAFRNFTSLLGKRFEGYVGEQLRSIKFADVRPEITYGNSMKSVDFFVTTPEVVLLVESKSAAPNAATRSGAFPEGGDIQSRLQRACSQISRSADLIKSGHPAFPELNGRQLRGLIVTREQYFNLTLPTMVELIKPQEIPTTIVSSQQLERALAGLSDDPTPGGTLLNALSSDTDAIKFGIHEITDGANPILESAYLEWFPFKHPPVM